MAAHKKPRASFDWRAATAIQEELSGVPNWAQEGWVNLRDCGDFVVPSSSQAVLAEAEQTLSPIKAFLEDCCDFDPSYQVAGKALWQAWQGWCRDSGHHAGSREKLGNDLRGQVPGIVRRQVRVGNARNWVYDGLQLNDVGQQMIKDNQLRRFRA